MPRPPRACILLVTLMLGALGAAPLPAEEPPRGARLGEKPLTGLDSDQTDPTVHWAAHLDRFEPGEISDDEAGALARASRIEKLAHDLYRALGGDDRLLLTRIGQVERLHLGALEALYRRYELEDGVASRAPGAFGDADLEAVYRRLLQEAVTDAGALEAAGEVEELEILALEQLLDITDDEDIRYTAGALLAGSRNHLRLLADAMEDGGAPFRPRHLHPETAERILGRDPEPGPLAGPLAGGGRRPDPEDLFEALEQGPVAGE